MDGHGTSRSAAAAISTHLLRHVSQPSPRIPCACCASPASAPRRSRLRVADERITLMRAMVENGEVDHRYPKRVTRPNAQGAGRATVRLPARAAACGTVSMFPEVDALYTASRSAPSSAEIDTGAHVELVITTWPRGWHADDLVGWCCTDDPQDELPPRHARTPRRRSVARARRVKLPTDAALADSSAATISAPIARSNCVHRPCSGDQFSDAFRRPGACSSCSPAGADKQPALDRRRLRIHRPPSLLAARAAAADTAIRRKQARRTEAQRGDPAPGAFKITGSNVRRPGTTPFRSGVEVRLSVLRRAGTHRYFTSNRARSRRGKIGVATTLTVLAAQAVTVIVLPFSVKKRGGAGRERHFDGRLSQRPPRHHQAPASSA